MRFQLKKKELYIPQQVDEKVIIEKYLQSFLCWIYKQNEDFAEYLTREEISNYFFNHLIHPVWFKEYMKNDTFRKSVEIDTYIHSYKSKPADKIFSYHYNIQPKENAEYVSLNPVEESINEEQKNILKKGGYEIADIEHLSKEEADYVILKN